MLVAGIRMKGFYSDCGKGFATLGKTLGRQIAGKPLCLFYDGEYREGDANFEPCMPIRKLIASNGMSGPRAPAAHCVTLLHHGPYEELKSSYAKLIKYVNEHGYKVSLPTREVYIKGPGMIFRGNPKKYVTEIQFPIEKKRWRTKRNRGKKSWPIAKTSPACATPQNPNAAARARLSFPRRSRSMPS